jgi:hypothetical protein
MSDSGSEPGTGELLRQEIFLALVTAQDQGMSVSDSRRSIAKRFGITEKDMLAIEREGMDNNWPPLG